MFTPENIIQAFNSENWNIEDFNIIGIRTAVLIPDKFNDFIGCLYKVPKLPNSSILNIQKHINTFNFSGFVKEDGTNTEKTKSAVLEYEKNVNSYQLFLAEATTVPGVYWLNHPENNLGTAVLESNKQFLNMWKVGLHKGNVSHPAFVQTSKCDVLRDFNLNDIAGDSANKDFGLFGINCHRANLNGKTVQIGKWSAGCQVFNEAKNLNKMLALANIFKPNQMFTYSLFKESSIL